MDAVVAENWRIPRMSMYITKFSLSAQNEQAGVGRDGRTCLVRLNSQVRRTGTTTVKNGFKDW